MKKGVTLTRKKYYTPWLITNLIFCLLCFKNSYGQNADPPPNNTFVLAWDKIGCQNDETSKLVIDASLTNGYILRVCQNSLVSYRIIGEGMQNVESVNWDLSGGEANVKDEFAAVKWDESYQGYLSFQINLKDGTSVEKTIIIRKFETDITLGWDKIGCQVDVDKVNEIKFSSTSTACLKVCKGSKVEYGLFGKDLENVQSAIWTITGGEVENPEGLKKTVQWNEANSGSMNVKLMLNNGSIIEKTFCVLKLDSSVLLEWEKIEESSLREFKLDNEAQEKDIIMIYPESTCFYKVSGKALQNIISINWEVHGGYAYIENGLATPISWFDEEENYLIIHLTYEDQTILERRINILKMQRPGGGSNLAPSSLKFTYDMSGNQTKREMIYLANRQQNKPKEDFLVEKKWIKSEEHTGLSYYPNPVKSELSLQWKEEVGEDLKEIELYNLSGVLMTRVEDLSDKNTLLLDFDKYPSGLYSLILVYAGNDSKTLKIVKK